MSNPLAFLPGVNSGSSFPGAPTHPEPMDVPAIEREIDASDQLGGGITTPGGRYGGEFSHEDWAAYLDAAKKLGFAKGIEHLRPLLEARDRMKQPSDATAVAVPTLATHRP